MQDSIKVEKDTVIFTTAQLGEAIKEFNRTGKPVLLASGKTGKDIKAEMAENGNVKIIYQGSEQDFSPLVNQMQILEKRIRDLEKKTEERAHLIDYQSYLYLDDRLKELEAIRGLVMPNLDQVLCDIHLRLDYLERLARPSVTTNCESCCGTGNFMHFGNEYHCSQCDGNGKEIL
jgi:hypothetical protein